MQKIKFDFYYRARFFDGFRIIKAAITLEGSEGDFSINKIAINQDSVSDHKARVRISREIERKLKETLKGLNNE